ncbi:MULTISPECIES: glutathione S-transferase family protein [unclassified Coleofasciculus]|uniref:glutathione S-transferase family protein n=1 Tax=unclassified Coleofasciculus TaxID=2692782 RepID=UPI00187F8C2D|nr:MULTISPECIES: glutathione S-transferase family protein [unclassified Coleofasciculus]MBE9129843.1 glutathione S-transferase family protein [Coleofasciculus sp. LEGE 07081]MBE9152286.1 glutathione S-transferase family protein [Coleofasciculus sp. LEGE 07092]
MLTLYHAPISPNSRRVWITLLEKGLEFELVEIKLDGEQFKPDFLGINPFHHIPVLTDDDFNIVESLAILDYLEAKYPTPTLLPKDAKELAMVRMVQLVTVNELLPSMNPLMLQMLDLPGGDPEKIEQAQQKVATVLRFFENLLDDRPYFGSETLSLAEVVAGTVVPWLPKGGVSLGDYPKLRAWCDRLMARPAWQATEATPEMIEGFKSIIAARMAQSNG